MHVCVRCAFGAVPSPVDVDPAQVEAAEEASRDGACLRRSSVVVVHRVCVCVCVCGSLWMGSGAVGRWQPRHHFALLRCASVCPPPRLPCADDTFELDYAVVASAQMVLAAMCTPVEDVGGGPPTVGGLIDGRKHVVVTLGKNGLIWLHAPPRSAEHAVSAGQVRGGQQRTSTPGCLSPVETTDAVHHTLGGLLFVCLFCLFVCCCCGACRRSAWSTCKAFLRRPTWIWSTSRHTRPRW